MTGTRTEAAYSRPLRLVGYRDPATDKRLDFLTNHFEIPAQTVADLYRHRWRVELFFKWIKQHLRIKSFFGVSENAVKTRIWIAVSVYVLVAIVRYHFALSTELYTIFTDFEPYAIRENAVISFTFKTGLHSLSGRFIKAV